MSIKKKTILFTIEHKEREFIPKCFLAYELIKQGYRVYIGSVPAIDRVAKKIGPSIFFHKSTFVNRSAFYKSLGHCFVFMDEEGGITTSRSATEGFCIHRYRTVSKEREDLFFLPGKRFENYISKLPNVKGVDFHTTGWPRVDLWREEFRYLYRPKIDEIKKKHGEYYLLVTSFGMTNKKSYEDRMKRAQKPYIPLYQHKYNALLVYIELIGKLSKLMQPGEKLIVRPHPSESIADWSKITQSFNNVFVIRDGDITPWILASSGVVQYASTTATQAALNGITCIQYKIDWQEGITDTPSFELCEDAQTPESVYSLLVKNKNTKNSVIQNRAIDFLKKEMAFDESELAVTKMVRIFEKIKLNPIERFTPSFIDVLKPYMEYLYSYIKLLYYKVNKFSSPKKTIIDKIPGGIEESEVQYFIELFSKNDNSNIGIKCMNIKKDLVSIETETENDVYRVDK